MGTVIAVIQSMVWQDIYCSMYYFLCYFVQHISNAMVRGLCQGRSKKVQAGGDLRPRRVLELGTGIFVEDDDYEDEDYEDEGYGDEDYLCCVWR